MSGTRSRCGESACAIHRRLIGIRVALFDRIRQHFDGLFRKAPVQIAPANKRPPITAAGVMAQTQATGADGFSDQAVRARHGFCAVLLAAPLTRAMSTIVLGGSLALLMAWQANMAGVGRRHARLR